MKALVGAFNQEKALVGAFSVIVQPVVELMDRFAALLVTVRSGAAAAGGSCQLATAPRSQLTHSDPWSAVRSQEAEFPRSFLIQQQPVSHRGRGCKPLFSEYSRVRLRGSSSVNTTLPLALRRTPGHGRGAATNIARFASSAGHQSKPSSWCQVFTSYPS